MATRVLLNSLTAEAFATSYSQNTNTKNFVTAGTGVVQLSVGDILYGSIFHNEGHDVSTLAGETGEQPEFFLQEIR